MDKRIVAAILICLGLLACSLGFPSSAGAQAAPQVVSTEPADGATDISPDVGKIVVKFDQPGSFAYLRESSTLCRFLPPFPKGD